MEKISAIICHHKGDLVNTAIASVATQAGVEVEVILASSDQTTVDRFQGITNVRAFYCEGGPAHKRNMALRYCQYSNIAFFDDDVEVTEYACESMVKELVNPGIGMVFGKLMNMEFRKRFDEAGSYLTSSGFLFARAESGCQDVGQFSKVEPVLAGKSASCMIRRSVFVEIGMFDASYEILGEETDLAWRVWLSGHKVLYVPSSTTYHAFGTKYKPKDFYIPKRVFFNGCRNYLTMLYTNLGKKRWIIPITVQLIVWTSAGVGMYLTGKKEASINIFKGLFYFFRNIRSIWNKRYHVQRNLRKIQDKELLPIVMRTPPISYYINRFFSYIKQGQHGQSYKPVKT